MPIACGNLRNFAARNKTFMSNQPQVTLAPLEPDDKEQFILDNQWAFKYGATEEFGVRDDHFEEDGEIGNGGVTHLDETTRKKRRSAFDSESRKSEKRRQSPATDGHGPKMRATDSATLCAQQKRTTLSGNHRVEQSAEIGRAANCRRCVIWTEK